MVTIDNGLSDSRRWSLSLSTTNSQGVKRTRTISGINLVDISASAEDINTDQEVYSVNPATGYSSAEVDSFARSISALLGETFETAVLVGKFDLI